MSRGGETFYVLFAEKIIGACWGVVSLQALQRGDGEWLLLYVALAAAFTYWRTTRFSIVWNR